MDLGDLAKLKLMNFNTYSDNYEVVTKLANMLPQPNGWSRLKEKIELDYWNNKEEILSKPETKLKSTKELEKTINKIKKSTNLLKNYKYL